MTRSATAPDPPGDAATTPAPSALYVVRVADVVDERIAGHGGGTYTSSAQPLRDALALAGLLLGGPVSASDGDGCTRAVAIAGGRRTVTLQRASRAP